jgi:hypothetical protein
VEYRVNFSVLRELYSIVLGTSLFLNEKRSDFDLVQLLSGPSCFEVLCQKVHLIPPL